MNDNVIEQRVFEMKRIIETHLLQNLSQLQLKYQQLLDEKSTQKTNSQNNDDNDVENKCLPTFQQKLREYLNLLIFYWLIV
jgi:hypothetical protein